MVYKTKTRERQECLECGHTIQYGRSDKKFCSESCKNRYHNRKGYDFLKVHSKTIRILDNNYKILDHCLDRGLTSIGLSQAVQWGFNPEYVTGFCKNKIKLESRCYDIRYNRSETRIYRIARIEKKED